MSLADQALEGATIDHVALSVGDLDTLTHFYEQLGFTAVSWSDFAPAPVRSALLRTASGVLLELTEHADSFTVPPAKNPIDAAQHRGLFHFALRVSNLTDTVRALEYAGARLVVAPGPNSRGDGTFAYVADPEGNLIELVSAPAD
jgi:glyoxylase I family protein